MVSRVAILASVTALMLATGSGQAASVRTTNFIVEAATQELAQEFGKLAEYYRKQKAVEWLGQEMPRWSSPCPLRITVSMSGAKGATTFNFPDGQVNQSMFIEGPLERLRNSVLPHEITHTVLAHHFRRPVPRWADEGGSVYSEDEIERTRHDRMCRDILNAGRGMPLRRLFSLTDYPSDVMVLYAEGYSVSKYLVESSDRTTFLNFVGHGMKWGWDDAARTYFRFKNVDEMEQAWLDHLKKGRGAAVASITNPNPPNSDAKLVVRQSIPPAQPVLDPIPVSRGLSPTATRENEMFRKTPTNQPQPPARLGDPIPFNNNTTPVAKAPVRYSPPPVVLFPPEPLPLR